MVQRVNVNGVIHQFPDEATPQMIAQALGVEPPDEDVSQSLYTKPERYANALGINNRTPLDMIRDALSGAVTGLGKGGEFIAKTATGGYAPDFPETIANQIASHTPSTAGQLVKGAAEYAPYADIGGASLLGQIGAGALSGAATTDRDETNLGGLLPSGKVGGSIEAALLNALTGGTAKAFEALRPSNIFRGNASPEQLQKNVEATQGTETGLGDVTSSPFFKRLLENTLQRLPFTGASESLQRTGNEIVSRGNNLLKSLLGNTYPENVPEAVSSSLNDSFEARKKEKASLYNAANKKADDIGLNLDLPKFSNTAKKYSDAIENTTFLKNEPDMAAIYRKLQNYKNPVKEETTTGMLVDKAGNPLISNTKTTYPTLEEANILKGRLAEKAKQSGASPLQGDREMSNVFSTLSKSLKSDINNAIDKSGNDDLKNAYQSAEKNYAKNFSPFLDRDIYKHLAGTNTDNQTIVDKFIKTGRGKDRSNLANKLLEKLPDQKKSLVAYHYLSKALDDDGNVSPNILAKQISNLGSKQFKLLVPDDNLRNNLSNYSKLTKMNQEALSTMFNPKTGQRNLDSLLTGVGAGATATGHARALATALLGGRAMTKALTSESIRNALVKKMIENRSLFTGGAKIPSYQTGTQALKNALGGGNNQ